MARVNWQGTEIKASVVEQLPNGNYRMLAQTHGPRIEPGTFIEVKPEEIIAFDVGGATFNGPGAPVVVGADPVLSDRANVVPMPAPAPPAQPTPAAPETITITKADVGDLSAVMADLQSAPTSTSVIPPAAPVVSKPSRTTMASAKTPKLNSLMDGFNSMIAAVENSADAVHKKFAEIGGNAKTSTTKLSRAADPIVAMVKQIDDTANQLSNGAPDDPLAGSTS